MSVCAVPGCGAAEFLQEHHLSYVPEVTEFLCVGCHELVHGHYVGLGRGVRRSDGKSPFSEEPFIGYRRIHKMGRSYGITLPAYWMYKNCFSRGVTELLCISVEDIRIVNPEYEDQVGMELSEALINF